MEKLDPSHQPKDRKQSCLKVDMECGFIFLETIGIKTTQRELLLTLHITPWRTCIYQEWVLEFDDENPSSLIVPTWISLMRLPLEFREFKSKLAAHIGMVYAEDTNNRHSRDPRVCVA